MYQQLVPFSINRWRLFQLIYTKAITHLQKAIAVGYDNLEWLKTDDSLESIRGEEGYKALVKKLEERDL